VRLRLPGTTLARWYEARRRKIRGVESNGMLCSERELGIGDDADGIIELAADARPGTRLATLLQLPDHVLELNLTPNRGDCFSIRGIAREVAALTGAQLKPALADGAVTPVNDASRSVIIDDTAACPRFAGRTCTRSTREPDRRYWMTSVCAVAASAPFTRSSTLPTTSCWKPGSRCTLTMTIALSWRHPSPFCASGRDKSPCWTSGEINLNPDTLVISDDSGPIGLAGIMGGLKRR
jgi:phenylalanyl-tRNA synthetase beta chain